MNLHAFLSRLRGAGDAVLALAALGLVALLVAPVPPAALDLLLALNLGLSATILVVTLFAKDALGFASFPTLLLFTTLFRLALNVSSTRLVLTRGDAGRVIEAFGRVIVQGNWVVGAVVFAILAVVQLLVVAKGAERVAEVAARFTLDALPGKQMSIDADLRAGLVDQQSARRRRRALERESQLYGAMDGALKFVKGDAIAGLVIVFVNVSGGLLAGLMKGMPLDAAVRRYTVLAIGDGLVSQVPALLLALAAGVAVTRVAGEEEGGTLGTDVARQLLSDPRPLAAVAGLLALFAVVPGLPAAPFLLLAAVAGLGARHAAGAPSPSGDLDTGNGASAGSGHGSAHLAEPGDSPVTLELAPDLIAAFSDEAPLCELPANTVELLWRERGVRIASLPLREAPFSPRCWRLLVDEVAVAGGRLEPDQVLSLAAPDDLALAGIDFVPSTDPLTGTPAALVGSDQARRAAALGPLRGASERLASEVAAALAFHAHLVLGVQEVQVLLEALESSAPALVREVARLVPPATLAETLRRLLEEQVSIRPLRTILQAVIEAGGAQRGAAALAEACRRSLKRHLAQGLAPAGELAALVLDPLAEAQLREALCGELLAVSPDLADALLGSLASALGETPLPVRPVLVAAAELRRPLRALVSSRFPALPVLCWEELPAELRVRPIARLPAALGRSIVACAPAALA